MGRERLMNGVLSAELRGVEKYFAFCGDHPRFEGMVEFEVFEAAKKRDVRTHLLKRDNGSWCVLRIEVRRI